MKFEKRTDQNFHADLRVSFSFETHLDWWATFRYLWKQKGNRKKPKKAAKDNTADEGALWLFPFVM